MGTVRVPNDEPETWAPTMPKEDDEQTPHTPPTTIVIRDTQPIEERGHADIRARDERIKGH